ATIRGAEELLASAGGSPELWQRCRQARADVDMLKNLEQARLQQAAGKDNHFHNEAAESLYAAALQTYGLSVVSLEPQEAAEGIAASAIAQDLVAALLDWAWVIPDAADRRQLRVVARLAEREPWRQEVLVAVSRGDWAALEKLAQNADAARHPPGFL